MNAVNETFSKEEWQGLKALKKELNLSWHDFIIQGAIRQGLARRDSFGDMESQGWHKWMKLIESLTKEVKK